MITRTLFSVVDKVYIILVPFAKQYHFDAVLLIVYVVQNWCTQIVPTYILQYHHNFPLLAPIPVSDSLLYLSDNPKPVVPDTHNSPLSTKYIFSISKTTSYTRIRFIITDRILSCFLESSFYFKTSAKFAFILFFTISIF